jgi:hypothetical protein
VSSLNRPADEARQVLASLVPPEVLALEKFAAPAMRQHHSINSMN